MKNKLYVIYLIILLTGNCLLMLDEVKAQSQLVASIDTLIANDLITGGNIDVPVHVANWTNIGAFGVWLTFDPNVLKFDTIVNAVSSIANSMLYSCNKPSYDTIRIGWSDAGSSGINFGTKTLFKLRFTYLGGSSNINFIASQSGVSTYSPASNVNVKFINGEVTLNYFNFNLLIPEKGKYTNSIPLFAWQASKEANFYKLFIDGLPFKDSIYATDYQLKKTEVLSGGNHSWFVVADNEIDTVQSNTTSNFIVDDTPPENFDLYSPQNNSEVYPCNVVFNWEHTKDLQSGLSGYIFYLYYFANLDSAISLVLTQNTQDTSLIYPGELLPGNYYWLVQAEDNVGNIRFSSTFNFVVNQNKIYSVKGYLTYDNSGNTPMSNVKLVLTNNEGHAIDSTLTDSVGFYRFNSLSNGNYAVQTLITKAPGGINPVDALLVDRYYIKSYKFTDDLRTAAADVNADNQINPLDALLINRYYIKSVHSFKAGKWLSTQALFKISCDSANVNIKSVCIGDVNASYIPN